MDGAGSARGLWCDSRCGSGGGVQSLSYASFPWPGSSVKSSVSSFQSPFHEKESLSPSGTLESSQARGFLNLLSARAEPPVLRRPAVRQEEWVALCERPWLGSGARG